MTTHEDVERWRALADATPGKPWVTCEANHGDCPCGLVWSMPDDVQVAMAGHGDDPIPHEAMIAVREFIAASREAVPAMAEALCEAAELLAEWDAAEGELDGCYAKCWRRTREWLADWRGDPAAREEGARVETG